MIKTQEMVEEKRGRELERKNVTVSFGKVKKIEKKLSILIPDTQSYSCTVTVSYRHAVQVI